MPRRQGTQPKAEFTGFKGVIYETGKDFFFGAALVLAVAGSVSYAATVSEKQTVLANQSGFINAQPNETGRQFFNAQGELEFRIKNEAERTAPINCAFNVCLEEQFFDGIRVTETNFFGLGRDYNLLSRMKFDAFDTALGTLNDVSVSIRIINDVYLHLQQLPTSCSEDFIIGSDCSSVENESRLILRPDLVFPTTIDKRSSNTNEIMKNESLFGFGENIKDAGITFTFDDEEYQKLIDASLTDELEVFPELSVNGTTTLKCDFKDNREGVCKGGVRAEFLDSAISTFLTETVVPELAITVEYNYDPFVPQPTPVPLPAGMPLLLAGLGGLVALRRRR